MTSKLRGSRLETEVDKCRGECNWNRLRDLLKSIQAKNSGAEKLGSLIEGELCLETYLEKIPGRSFLKNFIFPIFQIVSTQDPNITTR